MHKRIRELLIIMNSTGANLFKYPVGNKELTKELKDLESKGLIKFNELTRLWERR